MLYLFVRILCINIQTDHVYWFLGSWISVAVAGCIAVYAYMTSPPYDL